MSRTCSSSRRTTARGITRSRRRSRSRKRIALNTEIGEERRLSAVWLIGDPVAHSLSPAMHNAAFATLGLPHRYEVREVKAAELADAPGSIRRAGGAARACVVELLRAGVEVSVANRTRDRAESLARSIRVDHARARAVTWPTQDDLDATDLVVNATPLGMHNEDPIKGRRLPRAIVDLIPLATETPLVKRAKAAENV